MAPELRARGALLIASALVLACGRPARPPRYEHVEQRHASPADLEDVGAAAAQDAAASATATTPAAPAAPVAPVAPVDPARIAVLLPLSGRYASLGRPLRAAIELAAAGDSAQLTFIDTAGEVERARAAVDAAVLEHHAIAIVGPVGQQEGAAAAERAAELGVPIVLLHGEASNPGAAATASWRFYGLLSPAAEARAAAEVAIELGYDRLAVLAPKDALGAEQAAAFAAAAREAGLPLVASGSYDPAAANLERELKAFFGLDPHTNERLRRHLRTAGKNGWKTFSPEVPFELLYIPDGYERAALIASYLPYFNVEPRTGDFMDLSRLRRKHGRMPQTVQLLGSSGWHHPSLPTRGGAAVEGAVVLDTWMGSDNEQFANEQAATFAQAFLHRTGVVPGATVAQTFDTTRMVLQARQEAAGDAQPRVALARHLRGVRGDGAAGPAAFAAGGAMLRQVLVLRVQRGDFVLHEY